MSAAEFRPRYILAPYVATPPEVVDRLLALAELTPGDRLYDLGCGDGRIVIEAARQYGSSGIGIDIEPHWIDVANAAAATAGVAELASFRLQDALDVELADATVIVLYLVPWSMQKLATLIAQRARPGTRIISHSFAIDGWPPEKTEVFVDSEGTQRSLYRWRLAGR